MRNWLLLRLNVAAFLVISLNSFFFFLGEINDFYWISVDLQRGYLLVLCIWISRVRLLQEWGLWSFRVIPIRLHVNMLLLHFN